MWQCPNCGESVADDFDACWKWPIEKVFLPASRKTRMPTNNRSTRISMNFARRSTILRAMEFALLLAAVCGCGKAQPERSAADLAPFKKAIAEYLERNNMAMALKEIKQGPDIHQSKATLTASLVHATMPGPAVTWQFDLEKNSQGEWKVLSHKP